VLQPVRELLKEQGEIVALIKPQFEAGREKVGKKGVVRDSKVHEEVINLVSSYAATIGFDCLNLEYSPIKGPEGNIEYLLYLRKMKQEENLLSCPQGASIAPEKVKKIVEIAHNSLAEQ
jgi:23S rRNA (cytidine1920-2'-O)/16S rRNA (cytidine1409-2'-O)-methyltransferase